MQRFRDKIRLPPKTFSALVKSKLGRAGLDFAVHPQAPQIEQAVYDTRVWDDKDAVFVPVPEKHSQPGQKPAPGRSRSPASPAKARRAPAAKEKPA